MVITAVIFVMVRKELRGAIAALTLLFLVGGAMAATYHFSLSGSVTVVEGNVTTSPGGFSTDVATDTEYVKEIDVENSGGEIAVYFDDVVQGPDPGNVSVGFSNASGGSISSGNKLTLPAGTVDEPSETTVYVHVDVDEDAEAGEYEVLVQAKET